MTLSSKLSYDGAGNLGHGKKSYVPVAYRMSSRTAVSNAINWRSFSAVHNDDAIRVYDDAGSVIETHEHKGEFREW
jgi:hypothetical protein